MSFYRPIRQFSRLFQIPETRKWEPFRTEPLRIDLYRECRVVCLFINLRQDGGQSLFCCNISGRGKKEYSRPSAAHRSHIARPLFVLLFHLTWPKNIFGDHLEGANKRLVAYSFDLFPKAQECLAASTVMVLMLLDLELVILKLEQARLKSLNTL